uniref:Uncharacterized protein n=1 Tax=Arundo donax TaxID=35708 RepID=A0A0A9ELS5_ARUDO
MAHNALMCAVMFSSSSRFLLMHNVTGVPSCQTETEISSCLFIFFYSCNNCFWTIEMWTLHYTYLTQHEPSVTSPSNFQ